MIILLVLPVYNAPMKHLILKNDVDFFLQTHQNLSK